MNQEFLNRITNADYSDIIDKIEDKSIDLLLTDPPYGVIGNLSNCKWDDIDIISFTKNWYERIKSKMKDNSSTFIFWSQKYLKEGLEIFNPNRILIWHHPNLAKPTNKMFLWTYDPILFIKNGKPIFNASFVKKENVDIFRYAKPQNNYKKDKRYHLTSKPIELIKLFVKISTKENDLVVDIFSGGSPVAVACKLMNRNFICIEKEKNYCEISEQRLKEMEAM